MADQQKGPEGLVVTDDSGNFYYFRPEVLAQAKMPDEDVQKLKSGLAASSGGAGELSMGEMQSVAGGFGGGGFQMPGMPKIPTPSFDMGSTSFKPKFGEVMTSTVMCPW